MISVNWDTPEEIKMMIADQARRRRLDKNFSRKTLSERSGVPEGTVKHFELTGQISLNSDLALIQKISAPSNMHII